jgi:hypothetical protein
MIANLNSICSFGIIKPFKLSNSKTPVDGDSKSKSFERILFISIHSTYRIASLNEYLKLLKSVELISKTSCSTSISSIFATIEALYTTDSSPAKIVLSLSSSKLELKPGYSDFFVYSFGFVFEVSVELFVSLFESLSVFISISWLIFSFIRIDNFSDAIRLKYSKIATICFDFLVFDFL